MSFLKCYCGHIWTFEELEKGSTEDEFGHYFYCPHTKDCNDDGCCGLNYISEEWANGVVMDIYKPIRDYYLKEKEERRLKQIQKKHKYTMEQFIK